MKLIKTLFILSSLLFFVITQAQDGLVAHWSFDSLSNNQFINHVDGQPGGTVYGSQLVPGPIGNALSFDGVNDYARIPEDNMAPPAILKFLNKGSISLWFRVDHIPTDFGIRPIFYYGGEKPCDFFDAANGGMIIEVGHSPIHNGSKRLYFTEWTNGCTYPSFCYDSWNPIVEGQWYHYVAVVGGNFNTGYLDGEEMDDRKYNFGYTYTHEFFSDAVTPENLWIGRGYWDATDVFFEGAIDEIKIFDHPLNQAEVDSLFAEGFITTDITSNFTENIQIDLYPNPAGKIINLKLYHQGTGQLTFKIYNTAGKIVLIEEVRNNNDLTSIDISNLRKGIYIYSIDEGSKTIKSDKLIVR